MAMRVCISLIIIIYKIGKNQHKRSVNIITTAARIHNPGRGGGRSIVEIDRGAAWVITTIITNTGNSKANREGYDNGPSEISRLSRSDNAGDGAPERRANRNLVIPI
jgi:hypothetical protein